jgi:hypothetical protein
VTGWECAVVDNKCGEGRKGNAERRDGEGEACVILIEERFGSKIEFAEWSEVLFPETKEVERKTDRERQRETDRERDRERQRQRETERDSQRRRERERSNSDFLTVLDKLG